MQVQGTSSINSENYKRAKTDLQKLNHVSFRLDLVLRPLSVIDPPPVSEYVVPLRKKGKKKKHFPKRFMVEYVLV